MEIPEKTSANSDLDDLSMPGDQESQQMEPLLCLGSKLASAGVGGYVEIDDVGSNIAVYYTKKPPDCEHVILQPGVVLEFSSEILRSLCELKDIACGLRSSWSCKKKAYGRLYARCSRGGYYQKSQGEGKRPRISARVGCTASVTAVPLTKNTHPLLFEKLSNEVYDEDVQDESERPIFCIVQSVRLEHSGHVLEPSQGEKVVFSRGSEIISNPQISSAINSFLRISSGSPGCILKASQYLRDLFPHIHIPLETIKNTVARVRKNNDDASDFADFLREKKTNGDIEYLQVFLEDSTGILKTVIWTLKQSKSIVERCGEIAFWDSTHNTTRYEYKLSSFTVVDSEGSSRAVMFCLSLSETAEDCKALLVAWHEAFSVRLPAVIFTDGDEAMWAAISSVPYSADIKHLICTFHLFDMNVKKRVQPVLTSTPGGNSWAGFRKGLSICREAGSEEELDRLWSSLLRNWVPESPSNESVRRYLNDHVWSKRRQWAVAFFQNSFTIGAASTQRSESWNCAIKAFSDTRSLVSLFKSLQCLTERQEMKEKGSTDSAVRIAPLKRICTVTGPAPISAANGLALSKYCCNELFNEISAAYRMGASQLSEVIQASEGKRGIEIEGTVQYTDSSDNSDVRSRTKVKVVIHKLSKRIVQDKHISGIECECLYTQRMRIPCRHSLCLCLDADRRKVLCDNPVISSAGSKSVLEHIIHQECGIRWRNPYAAGENTSEDNQKFSNICVEDKKRLMLTKAEGGHLEIDQKRKDEKDSFHGEMSNWSDSKSIQFPQCVSHGGRRRAYSILMGQFRSLSEATTTSNDALLCGFILSRLVVHLRQHLSEEQSAESSLLEALKSKFIHCIDSSFQDLATRDGGLLPEQRNVPHGNTTCDIAEVSDGRPIFSKEEHVAPITEIQNPPLRRDHRRENRASRELNKTRDNRKRKREISRRTPAIHRKSSKVQPRIPERPKIGGYACPECTNLPIMNYAQNVRQHFVSAHSSKSLATLTLDAMTKAANSYQERCALNPPSKKSKKKKSAKSALLPGSKSPDNANESNGTESPESEKMSPLSGGLIDSDISEDCNIDEDVNDHERSEDSDISEDCVMDDEIQTPQSSEEEEIQEILERASISTVPDIHEKWRSSVSPNTFEIGNLDEVHQNSVVDIFWPQDLSWYRGRITDILKTGREGTDECRTRVSVSYTDGDEEAIDDMGKQKWRFIHSYQQSHDISWKIERNVSEHFSACMRVADEMAREQNGNDVMFVTAGCPVNAKDFRSLKEGSWLTDSVIESFGKAILRTTTSKIDHRVLVLSSHATVFALSPNKQNQERLCSWLDGIELHEIDMILWPVCFSNHWQLCVAYTQSYRAELLDPFSPVRPARKTSLASNVLQGLEMLSRKYKEKYKVKASWEYGKGFNNALNRHFPVQPASNGVDCGVLVCIYMWSYITAEKWPFPLSSNRSKRSRGQTGKTFAELTKDARVVIGSHIAKFAADNEK